MRLFRQARAVLAGRDYFAPDNIGVTTVWFGQQSTVRLYESTAGEPATKLAPAGKRFAAEYRSRYGEAITAGFVITVAKAAHIALEAIARSNGTRASVARELLAVRVVGGQLGSFRFDRNGDPARSPFTVYRFRAGEPTHRPPFATLEDQGGVVDRVIAAPASLAAPLRR
jgi:ABC-type branched-subunit amino acid transport system substrate-binding protein